MSHNRIKMLYVYKIIIKNNFQYSEYKRVLICYKHEKRQEITKKFQTRTSYLLQIMFNDGLLWNKSHPSSSP